MDPKLQQLINDFNNLKRQWDTVFPELRELKRTVEDLKRELGISQGKLLHEQVTDVLNQSVKREELINRILREVEHTKKLVEYNDVNVKEIMKALALIYKNVDEIEDVMVPNRQTQ
ncbi:hypothetical protein H3C67_03110 [Candidatus Dojkabacteria bacterium]|uniref:Uncharacterized protein n=1 Tax=Candidatus Dojkabacteria bacterium TaxID=2099670 RepID=A0A952AH05_9BACT|nr:hypothetical protein [Candidatus Dojkabacteria bacterium]